MRKSRNVSKFIMSTLMTTTNGIHRCLVPSKLPIGQKATIAYMSDKVNKKLLLMQRLDAYKFIMSGARIYYTANQLIKNAYCENVEQALNLIRAELEKRNYVI